MTLLNALHDVYLQGVHIRGLILALGATEVRRLLGRAPPLAGQDQVRGVVSWGEKAGPGYGTDCREGRGHKVLRHGGLPAPSLQPCPPRPSSCSSLTWGRDQGGLGDLYVPLPHIFNPLRRETVQSAYVSEAPGGIGS